MADRELEKLPFKRGDCVIDDNGEIGYVLQSHTSATWDPDGKLTQWTTNMNYRWDQDSYGETRRVTDGEITLYSDYLAEDTRRENNDPLANQS